MIIGGGIIIASFALSVILGFIISAGVAVVVAMVLHKEIKLRG
jgi:hypothetical protein